MYEKLWLRKYWFRLSGDGVRGKQGRINVYVWQSLKIICSYMQILLMENTENIILYLKVQSSEIPFENFLAAHDIWYFNNNLLFVASFPKTSTDSLWLLLFRLVPVWNILFFCNYFLSYQELILWTRKDRLALEAVKNVVGSFLMLLL